MIDWDLQLKLAIWNVQPPRKVLYDEFWRTAMRFGFLPGKLADDFPATGFIPVVLGILHYSG